MRKDVGWSPSFGTPDFPLPTFLLAANLGSKEIFPEILSSIHSAVPEDLAKQAFPIFCD